MWVGLYFELRLCKNHEMIMIQYNYQCINKLSNESHVSEIWFPLLHKCHQTLHRSLFVE